MSRPPELLIVVAVLMSWQTPQTRPSILIRVHDPSDDEAWHIFESIYRPVIVRVAQRKGLQSADADDVAQTVLAGLSQRPWQFSVGTGDTRFRTWLSRVTENAVIDQIRKRQRDAELVQTIAAEPQDTLRFLELEFRREVFQWAAKIVRGEFTEDAWQCFWLTAVEQQSPEAVAQQLDRTVGSVYSSRSRIMRRLRQQVKLFDETLEGEL